MHHDKFGFITEIQGWLNMYKSINIIQQTNRIKDKKFHDHLINCRKNPLKNIGCPTMIIFMKKLAMGGEYHNKINAIYKKPLANIILNGEKMKLFLLKSLMTKCSFSP
jgi:hypothetical protein